MRIDHLILSAILTDICLQHTAADAFFRGYKVTVPKECTEAMSDKAMDNALKFMRDMYNTDIVSLDDIIR